MAAVAGYALPIIGFLMVAFALATAFTSNPKYIYTRPLLINLLRTDAYRAAALVRASKGTYFEAIAGAIKTGGMMDSQDPAVVTSATKPGYDAAGTAVGLKWNQLVMKGKLGAAMATGGVVMAISGGSYPILPIVLASICIIGLVWVVLHKLEVERCIVRARLEILPEVDRAFVEGRLRKTA